MTAQGYSATSTDVRYTAAFGGNADNQPVIAGQSLFMMGWTPPDGIGVPKVEVLSTT
jgi:hypothetical protein